MPKTKILIIDDEPSIVFTIQEICNVSGYEAITAMNGQDGFELVKSNDVDLVIVDYNMPGWDGLITTKKIKAHDPSLPILVLTVDEQQQTADKFMAAGANDFSIKPIKAPDLIARINVHLQIRDMQKQIKRKKEDLYIEKGISYATLLLITEYLRDQVEPVTFEDITTNVNLAYQTVHRYIKFLESNSFLEITPIYGHLGRPKNKYLLAEHFDIQAL
ncbi:MAG: response regulator [Clostridia bacterium]|nr:response regulator [Clostridia bacterium]